MHVFMLKLCCLQRTSVYCRNYIVYSESDFTTKIVLSVALAAEIVSSAADQCSWPNCVVRSESCLAAELCCPQGIIVRCWIVLCIANQIHCWIVLFAANQCSLPNCVVRNESIFAAKLCCLQRINFRYRIVLSAVNQFSLPNCGVCSESIFTANCGVCSESIFTVKMGCRQGNSSLTILCFSELIHRQIYVISELAFAN